MSNAARINERRASKLPEFLFFNKQGMRCKEPQLMKMIFFSLMSITSENGNEQFCEKADNDSLRRTMTVEDVKTL